MAQVKKKMTNDEMVGLIREAMALRVKYRLKNSLGGKIDKNS